MKQGDIYMANMGKADGTSVQAGWRYILICSNNACNKFSPTVTAIPLTSQKKKDLPTHVYIEGCGLPKSSLALVEQITSISKSMIKERKVGSIQNTIYEEQITAAIKVQLNI